MTQEEFNIFKEKFEESLKIVQEPNLFVYLKTDLDTVKKRIEIRNREMEKNLDVAFLELVARMYEKFFQDLNNNISRAKLLVVETDALNADQVHETVLKHIQTVDWSEVDEVCKKSS